MTDTEKLKGSVRVKVRDEEVSLRMLAIKEYEEYFNLQVANDEVAMIALWTGKPVEWIEALSPEEHTKLIEEGEAVNLDPFTKWRDRTTRRQENLTPAYLRETIKEMAKETLQGSKTREPEVPMVVSLDGSRALPLTPGTVSVK